MQVTTHTIETEATPSQIWKVLEDVENWKNWDTHLEFSEIDGPFCAGTKGNKKFKDTPALKTLLKEVERNKRVVQEAYLPGAKVVTYQEISKTNGKTQVTFRVDIEGLAASLFYEKLESFIRRKVPLELDKMVKQASTITVS